MNDAPPHAPRLKAETLIIEAEGRQLAFIDGALWLPEGTVIELGDPNRDAEVKEVRLRLLPSIAQILVDVVDTGQTIERGAPRWSAE